MAPPSKTFVTTCLILNICCSTLIVLINKTIYKSYHFPNVLLTCTHFIMTTIGLVICQQLNLFQPKRLPIKSMLPLAMTFCGFVVFNNLSLEENTVGTYQLIKTMTTPCIMFIQTYFYSKSFSLSIKLTVVPIAIGVYLNSYYDMEFNLLGVIYATIGVCVTSLYQVWVAEKQHEFQVNSMQLLFYQAPLSAGLLMVVIPFIEPISDIAKINWTSELIGMVLLSGIVAFSVNLSIYWIIGNTSPVTYNMVGHLKFCITLMGGVLIFQNSINLQQMCGIITTLAGVIAYTHFKMSEQKKKQLPISSDVKK